MSKIKTKNYKQYSNAVRFAQSAEGKDSFMFKRKSINKQKIKKQYELLNDEEYLS